MDIFLSLCESVVGVQCAVGGKHEEARIARWLGPFETSRSPLWRIRWNRSFPRNERASRGFRAVAAPDAVTSHPGAPRGFEASFSAEGILRLQGFDLDATLDPRTRRGSVDGFSFGSLAQALLAALVLDDPEVLPLHASAVELEDGAHVFVGPSGCGKSTLARALGNPLADDICVLRFGGGVPTVMGMPLWEGRQASAPLAAVHVLRHGPLVGRRLGNREALARLMPETRVPLPPDVARARAFAHLCALVERGRVWELSFGLADAPSGVLGHCRSLAA